MKSVVANDSHHITGRVDELLFTAILNLFLSADNVSINDRYLKLNFKQEI